MTDVGEIRVTITATTKQLTTALALATKELRNFGVVVGRVAPSIANSYQHGFNRIGTAIHRNQTTLDNFSKTTAQTETQTRANMVAIGKSGVQMGNSINAGIQTAHGSFNTFRDFVDKIRHYIVFSIGVQMVMGIRRAFEYIIKSFMDFDQQAVRTAAVTGRLDAAFDKVVDNIKNVSKELARTSFFMATDVVKAMYDFACLPPDEKVLCGDYTYIKAIDIKVGDTVIGKDGKPTKVVNKFKRICSEGTIVNINPHFVDSFKVTPNHPLLIVRPKECKHQTVCKNTKYCKSNCHWERHRNSKCEYFKQYKPKWIDAGRVKESDFLLIPIIDIEKNYKINWNEFGDVKRQGNNMNLPQYVDEQFAYFLGRFMADGWITESNHSITIIYNDKEFDELRLMEQYINSLGFKTWRRDGSDEKTIKLMFSSSILLRFLKKFIGKGASNKKIPTFMYTLKKNIIKSFLKGYIDGDGYIDDRGYIAYSTTSENIHSSINLLFAKLGYVASQNKNKEYYGSLPSGWSGVCKPSYIGRVNNPNISFDLGYEKKQKPSKFNTYFTIDNYIAIPIKSIKSEEYYGYVYNIETEDNTFMTSVVTHNSAGFNVAGAVVNVNDGVAMMRPVIAYAAGQQIELTQATDLVATALKMFGLELDSTARVVDTFTAAIANSFLTNEKLADSLTHVGAIAHEFGMQIEETTAVMMSMMDAGYRAGSAGQALRMILLRLVDPTDKSSRALGRLGLTMADLDPAMHSFTEILYKLQSANFGVAQASEMFRARAAGVAAALVRNVEEVARYNRILYASAGITEQVAQKSEESFAGALRIVAAQLDIVAQGIGARLEPLIRGLASFVEEVMLPTFYNLVTVFDAIGGALERITKFLEPLRPIFDAATGALWIFISAWVGLKVALLGLGVQFRLVNRFMKAATLSSLYFSKAQGQAAVGTSIATHGLFAHTKALILHTKATFMATVKTHGLTTAMLACPLTWFALALGAVAIALFAYNRRIEEAKQEQDEYNEKIREFNDLFNNYQTSIDSVRSTLSDYISVQDEINTLIEIGKTATSEYTDVLARKQIITNQLKDDEREFLANSERLLNNIANRSSELADYVNEAKKANVEELKAIGLAERYIRTTEWIVDAEKYRIGLESEKVEKAEEYQEALQDEIKLKESLISIEKELTGTTGKLSKEVLETALQTGNLNELMHEEESALASVRNAMQDANNMLVSLTGTNERYAYAVREILSLQNEYMNLMDSLSKAQARLNLLTNTRHNIEHTMLSLIGDMTSSQLKLYDIELRIYRLRHDQINVVRSLFDALADQGALTKDIIDMYKNMEHAQGASLKAHVDYTKALEVLSAEQRNEVMEWTKIYIQSLDKGLSSTEAFLRANEIMGYAIHEIEGVSESVANSILAYAHAEHEARYAASQLEKELKSYTGVLVDADQASTDTARHYYDLIKTEKELAKENVELEKTQVEAYQSLEGMAETIAKLAWYYIETSDEAENFQDVLLQVVDALGLSNVVGNDNAQLLGTLNIFYGRTAQSIDEYTDSELLAFLTAQKLNVTLGDTGTLITDVRTSTEPTIDSIYDLVGAAEALKDEIFRTHPGLERLIDYLNTLEITEYTWMDAIGDMPISEWLHFEGISNNVLLNVSGWAKGVASDIGNLLGRIDEITAKAKEIERALPSEVAAPTGYWDMTMRERRQERDVAIEQQFGTGIGAGVVRAIDILGQGVVEGIGRPIVEGLKELKFWEKGAIVGDGVKALQRGIKRTTGPQLAMIGEAGAEAVVPLEGINKKYGRAILSDIIPKHFPEFRTPYMQTGGVIGTQPQQIQEKPSFVIQGDINVYGVQDVDDFLDRLMRELQQRRRMVQ